MKILNLAAGKLLPLDLPTPPNYCLVQLDTMYYLYDHPDVIESELSKYVPVRTKMIHSSEDAFTFMERTKIQFDRICAYRFLEHIPRDKVLYFIYLISTCLKIDGTVDIIVPDYTELARRLLEDDPTDPKFESKDILLTTELLNDPSCPHASIWTESRLIHFFCQVEGRFAMIDCKENYNFDGRDIYIRARFRRIK